MRLLMNKKWNGWTYSIEKFTGLHHTFYVQLEEVAQHFNFQLPTDNTQVGFLLDNIQNNDPDLRDSLAGDQINMNKTKNYFESEVAFLLTNDPYDKHNP